MKKRIRLNQYAPKQNQRSVFDVAGRVFEGINTDYANTALDHLKSGDYKWFANQEINPLDYTDSRKFQDDYVVASLLKKYELLPTDIDVDKVALEGFLSNEQHCRNVNLNDPLFWGGEKEKLHRSTLLFEMSREISKLVRKLKPTDLWNCSFGPGASRSCTGTDTTVSDKLKAKPEISRRAIPYLKEYLKEESLLSKAILDVPLDATRASATQKITITDYNKLAFVPKSAKTSRVICIEPTLNTFLQKGLGSELRRCLLGWRIDLRKQPELHGHLARQGSMDGSFATIDLSAASDTIAYNLVWDLFPTDWAQALDAMRCPYTQLPNKEVIENEKFSSMGNGYTFELETIIFAACVKVTSMRCRDDKQWSVFGDDIICSDAISNEVIRNLKLLGFKINLQKTFTTGNFRESCGQDYFAGTWVRPLFIKKGVTCVKGSFTLANGIRALARSYYHFYDNNSFADARFRTAWNEARNQIPKRYRFYGPRSLGDNVIHNVPDSTKTRTKYGIRVVKTLQPVPKKKLLSPKYYPDAVIISAGLMGGTFRQPLRGAPLCYLIKETPIPEWYGLEGRWI